VLLAVQVRATDALPAVAERLAGATGTEAEEFDELEALEALEELDELAEELKELELLELLEELEEIKAEPEETEELDDEDASLPPQAASAARNPVRISPRSADNWGRCLYIICCLGNSGQSKL
jgi:hypothetical protein